MIVNLILAGILGLTVVCSIYRKRRIYQSIDRLMDCVLSQEKIELSDMKEGELSALVHKVNRIQEVLGRQVEKAEEEKEQVKSLVSNMAHQLKTPFANLSVSLKNFILGGKDMKEMIKVTEYAQMITEALPKGILLNTKDKKFNSMVIAWGGLGTVWGKPVFTVYVREHRYTKAQLDSVGEFTVSVPLDKPVPVIAKVCGTQSGRDVDKETEANLTLEASEMVSVPGIKEYPLTLECKVLYSQRQELEKLPDDIREKMYPQDVDGTYPMANRDAHTAYIGEIVAAYIIR